LRCAVLAAAFLVAAGHVSPGTKLQSADLLAGSWKDLASKDAGVAYSALWQLVQHPGPAVKMLRQELKPAVPPDEAKIQQWMVDLASDTFAVREKATRELQQLGELAEPALRKAMEGKPDLETRRRAEKLLERLAGVVDSPDKLRSIRAVEALEFIASADAKALLKDLTKGHAQYRLTREAQESLIRLEERIAWAKAWPAGTSPFAAGGDPLLACVRARFGTTLFRHHDFVRTECVSFCGDNRVLVTLDRGGVVYLWEAQTGKLHRRLKQIASFVVASSQGTWLALALSSPEEKGTIVLWDWQHDKEVGRMRLPEGVLVERLALTPDGRQLLCKSTDNCLRVWDAQSRTETKVWKPANPKASIKDFAVTGSHVLVQETGFEFGIVKIADGSQQKLIGFDRQPYRFAFSPDGKYVATGNYGGRDLKIWDVASGKLQWLDSGRQNQDEFIFSPDGKHFAASGYLDKCVSLWDPQAGQYLKTLPDSQEARVAAFSSDSQWLACVTGNAVRVWNLKTGQMVQAGQGQCAPARQIAFVPEQGLIATESGEPVYRWWDPATGQQTKALPTDASTRYGVGFSRDGKLLAISGDSLDVWDVTAGQRLYRLTGHARLGLIKRLVQFSGDGRCLLSWGGSDSLLRKWDMRTGKALIEFRTGPGSEALEDPDRLRNPRRLEEFDFGFADAAFTVQGREFMLAAISGKIDVYDIESGKQTRSLDIGTDARDQYYSLVLSPDSKHFCASRRTQLTVHDLATGKTRFALTQLEAPYTAHFSPDGRTIAVAMSSSIMVVELASGKVRLDVKDLPVNTRDLAFSPDGMMLVTAMADTTSWLWDLAALAGRGPK
jgi:WD40 repeat protein